MIQTFLFPPRTDLAHHQSLVVAVVPLGDILGERDLVSDARAVVTALEEKAKGLLRPLTRANPYACDPGRVDQLAGPNELGPGSRDLAYALEREFEVCFSRVAAVLGPFCFSWSYACYLDYLLGTLEGGELETLTVAGEEYSRRRSVELGHDRSKSDLDNVTALYMSFFLYFGISFSGTEITHFNFMVLYKYPLVNHTAVKRPLVMS